MDYDTIILSIVNNNEIKEIAYKIANNSSLSNDLYQEIILTLLEMDKDKLMKMHQTKELNYYIVRVAISHYRNPNNTFAKNYQHLPIFKTRNNELARELVKLNRDTDTSDYSKHHKAFKKLSWYEQNICKIYAELGSSRKVQEKTGISYRSVAQTVKNSKEWIYTFTKN